MNKVELIGRLGKDPRVNYSGETAIANFNIAVTRSFKQDGKYLTDWITCVAFGHNAEFIEKYFKKGSMIALEGRIQTGSYEKDGQKIYTTDVVVEHAEFCGGKSENNNTDNTNSQPDDDFMSVPDDIDSELPFA